MAVSIPKKGESMNQCLARRRAEWAENADSINQVRRLEYQLKKDKINLARREKDATQRDKVREQLRASYARNSAARCEAAIQNHCLRKLRIPHWSEKEAIVEFYRGCPDGYEVDHIIPLLGAKVSGLHVFGNLQYLTPHENRAKKNRYEP